MWVSGADGCRAGWFRASRESQSGALRFEVLESARDLLERSPQPAVLAIDIPIGLSEAGPRECDRAARACLGPRRNSVFPAPVREALRARDRKEASRITEARDGRKVAAQAWALYPKIREVDTLLQSSTKARARIREVHPEVSFWAWSGKTGMAEAKKTATGKAQRLRLAENWLGAGVLATARGQHRKGQLADDDILDAIAALWTAERIARGAARTLPENPPLDATGLPMQMVY